MPQYDVTGPDGKVYSVNAPDGASQNDAIAYVKQAYYPDAKPAQGPASAPAPAPQPSEGLLDKIGQVTDAVNPISRLVNAYNNPTQTLNDVRDVAAGAVRGAGSIGATLMTPVDAWARRLGIQNDFIGRDDRRQAMDSALRDMGADTSSLPFQAAKIGAEIAGTAGIPVAAGRGIGLISQAPAVQALADAVATGGMRIGPLANQPASGALGSVLNAVRNGAIRTVGGATAGALSAGAVNPDDAGTGAVIGAAVPNVVQAFGAAGKALGKVSAAVSNDAAERNAVQRIADTLGDGNVPQAVADIQTYYPKGAENIPVSASAITKNSSLAQLEQGSRLRSAPAWNDFDLKQAKAVADNVTQATQDADTIGQLVQNRQANWAQNWGDAANNIKPRVWVQRMNKFSDDLNTAAQAAESSNPKVLQVIQGIQGEMDRLGPSFGPGNLQQIRANLSGKYIPTSTNPFESAPRDSMAVNTIKGEIDDILNASTGGKWQKVLDGYSADSRAIESADAARTVRNAFWDEQTGRVLGKARDAVGDVPSITEVGLGAAMNKARLPDRTTALAPQANQQLEATLEALRRQNMIQNLNRTATAGGGSATLPNAIAEGVAAGTMHHSPSMVLQLANAVKSLATGKTDAQMARLLTNPDDLAQSLGALGQAFNRGPSPAALATARALPVLATGN